MNTILMEVTLIAETCCTCGIPFGMPDYHQKKLKQKGGDFYCPNGHGQHYTNPEIPELKKRLKAAEEGKQLYKQWYQAEQSDHDYTRRRLSATKGVLTKTKKRIANGVCPCCNRHFVNLQRHMETKHPEYDKGEGEA